MPNSVKSQILRKTINKTYTIPLKQTSEYEQQLGAKVETKVSYSALVLWSSLKKVCNRKNYLK